LPATAFLLARAESRFVAHARTPWGFAFRSGALTRKWSATWPDRVQVLSLSETPFDRRHGMASLAVDTAGAGPARHRILVPYLARPGADALQSELARAAQAAG
jgi:putative membrane protein